MFAAIADRYEYIEGQNGDRAVLDLAVPWGRLLPEDDAAWHSHAPELLEALNGAYPPAVRRQGMRSGFTTARHNE